MIFAMNLFFPTIWFELIEMAGINGMHLNGGRLMSQRPAPIKHEDEIKIGRNGMQLKLGACDWLNRKTD